MEHGQGPHLKLQRQGLLAPMQAAQQRIADAEEDQQRAEQQAAALQEEVEQLRSQLASSHPAEGADAEGRGTTFEAAKSCFQTCFLCNGMLWPLNCCSHAGPVLHQQLEAERGRNAVLLAALSSAKAEREAARMEAASARLRTQQSAGVSVPDEYCSFPCMW